MPEKIKNLSSQKVIFTSLGVIGDDACKLAPKTTDAHVELPELEALGICIGLKKVIFEDFLIIVQIYFLEKDIVQLFKVARYISTDEMITKGHAIVPELAEHALEIHHMIKQDAKQAVEQD